ncbi:DUF1456 family protein [Reichenbachiella agarivorans]|uniref:DUF1456 family protein n=1 Tax=Reichenbachiella agarivorans TaxID=2979464 RepID=A0ABY6CQF6_9BACT|nr:DUF1456 family protein [Reichenbachiella agarivorans]UXP31673.1 DUF1456 family protein [Reichenbachiella agarivorans]
MNNNDIFRRIRFTFELSDKKVKEIFAMAGLSVTEVQVKNWLRKDEEPEHQNLKNDQLSSFLDGFIIDKRGKKEDAKPAPVVELNNNVIFRKLRIALNLDEQSILDLFDLVHMKISKHELSSFFRNPKQPQYRACQDQYLRNFLHGLQVKHRPDKVVVKTRLTKKSS